MFNAHGRDKGATESRLAMWLKIQKRTGKVKKELKEQPFLKPELVYLWDMYCEIKSGCDQITYSEIDAFCRLSGRRMATWEVSLLIKIDQVRCEHG